MAVFLQSHSLRSITDDEEACLGMVLQHARDALKEHRMPLHLGKSTHCADDRRICRKMKSVSHRLPIHVFVSEASQFDPAVDNPNLLPASNQLHL